MQTLKNPTYGSLVLTPDGYYGLMLGFGLKPSPSRLGERVADVSLANGLTASYPLDDLVGVPIRPEDPGAESPASFNEIVSAAHRYDEMISVSGQAAVGTAGLVVLRHRAQEGTLDPQKLADAERRVQGLHERLRFVLATSFGIPGLRKLAEVATAIADETDRRGTVNTVEVTDDAVAPTTPT